MGHLWLNIVNWACALAIIIDVGLDIRLVAYMLMENYRHLYKLKEYFKAV